MSTINSYLPTSPKHLLPANSLASAKQRLIWQTCAFILTQHPLIQIFLNLPHNLVNLSGTSIIWVSGKQLQVTWEDCPTGRHNPHLLQSLSYQTLSKTKIKSWAAEMYYMYYVCQEWGLKNATKLGARQSCSSSDGIATEPNQPLCWKGCLASNRSENHCSVTHWYLLICNDEKY